MLERRSSFFVSGARHLRLPLPSLSRPAVSDIRRSRRLRGGERGRGEGSHCFERNRRGPRCKESGFNPLPSRARRNGIGRFSCQGHRGGQLRLANNTGFSPGSRSSREISIVSLLFSRKLFFFFSRKIIIKQLKTMLKTFFDRITRIT